MSETTHRYGTAIITAGIVKKIVRDKVALRAGIILTIHTQDYKDVPGDAAAGRVTLPIAYPALSRAVSALLLIAWSWGISRT